MGTRQKVRQIEFEVEGSSTFPFDMLRYDSCYPATSVDASLLDHTHVRAPGERRRIKLRQNVVDGGNKDGPTVERWSSFAWRVLVDTVRKY